MLKRVVLIVVGSVLVTLLLTTVALAWTPQDIYDDFAAHGKLTHTYTDAELHAYLNDASVAQYADQDIKKRLDSTVYDMIGRGTFPFTGAQIAIICVVVVVLVGGGVALRVLTKPRHRKQLP